MSDNSHIEWTDTTWNPISGCTRVSPGCDHCYIARTPPFRMAGRKFNGDGPGSSTGVLLHPDRLDQPLHWRKPRRVFVNSLSDLFHDDVPDDYIARVFAVMALAPRHTFQILTKRPGRMRSLLSDPLWWNYVTAFTAAKTGVPAEFGCPLPNVWLGVSVEDQKWADIRIPALLDTPAAVRFLSCEPLLAPVTIKTGLHCRVCQTSHKFNTEPCDPWTPARFRTPNRSTTGRVDWVIVGGESGPGARPMHPDWARRLRDQCQAAGVPFFFKQWGEHRYFPDLGLEVLFTARQIVVVKEGMPTPQATFVRVGKHAAGRELDGRTWDEMPTGSG